MNAEQPAAVLVVDDDPQITKALGRILERAGYHVLETAAGNEALRLASDHEVRVAVCDMAMPEMDGLELITRLRQQRPDMKIIAISGVFGEPIMRAAKFLGADASMEKPITAERFLSLIRSLLEPTGRTDA